MQPEISIIIVTYHATPLTGLCLWSLKESGLKRSEVIIVDNAGTDAYADELAETYSFVRLIHNKENEGFGKGCNRGFKWAKGQLILFLNPDTIVPPDFEKKILDFFRLHPEAGAMGAKMIDGRGIFLRESKRNFPYPLTSFFKFTGVEKILPHKKQKWQYYANHISPDKTMQTQILCGAFMVVTRQAMLKTGGFDPRYFLYAEDIDLSWQILQSGWEVWYNPGIKIVHFKSETTKRSPDYSSVFYHSMFLFYNKYLNNNNKIKTIAVKQAIKLLSFTSLLKHKIKNRPATKSHHSFSLHPDSCPETRKKLQSIAGLNISFITESKGKTRHLLLSSETMSSDSLIECISNSLNRKYNVLWWEEKSGWLFKFSDSEHFSETVTRTAIK